MVSVLNTHSILSCFGLQPGGASFFHSFSCSWRVDVSFLSLLLITRRFIMLIYSIYVCLRGENNNLIQLEFETVLLAVTFTRQRWLPAWATTRGRCNQNQTPLSLHTIAMRFPRFELLKFAARWRHCMSTTRFIVHIFQLIFCNSGFLPVCFLATTYARHPNSSAC